MSNGAGPTAQPSTSAPHGSSGNQPVSLAVAAAGGALVLVAGLYFAGILSTGDEPPIRVKNGSLELRMLSSREHWKERPDAKHWKMSGGTRSKDPLDVTVAVNTGATCDAQAAEGNLLTVTYSNGTKVEIRSNGRHTWVDSTADLTLSDRKRLLTYDPTGGYISKVTLDSKLTCNFTSANQLAELVILDY